MKRREFFERAGLGSAALVALPGVAVASRPVVPAARRESAHQHEPISGPLASATVSFGQWSAGLVPALDRFPDLGAPGKPNGHQLIPHEVTVRAGGTINFIIAGFHHVLVYGDGVQPGDIDVNNTIPPTGQPAPPLINDPLNRVYRGLDPSRFPQDRVEVVQFPNPGTYLVICGVRPHFVNDGMYGFVKVNP
jgi:plastocyanin